MTWFRFTRDFGWWGPNTKCRGCALVLYWFKGGDAPIQIPEEAAKAAEAAGAGVPYEAFQQ